MKTKSTPTLIEAKRLFDLGFAIHWCAPKQKRPVESKWTTGERKPWSYLKETYFDGLNVGVRTGTPSHIDGDYLACIDVDIKKPEAKFAALAALKNIIGDEVLPEVRSGGGNGSRHLYCVTPAPFKMITAYKEDDWEICIYSDGRQMVLPPSIHPSGKPYQWIVPIPADGLPQMVFDDVAPKKSPKSTKLSTATVRKEVGGFVFQLADVPGLDWLSISPKMLKAIKTGEAVEDRSAWLLPASEALYKAGLSRDEVLTVLTDKDNYLGGCAYDHAKTTDRARAAYWLYKFTVKSVIDKCEGVGIFKPANLYELEAELSEREMAEQTAEMEFDRNWMNDLVKSGQHGEGPPKPLVSNIVLILENAVSFELFKHNEFAYRDIYGCETPWGSKPGEVLKDNDVPKIRFWLSKRFRFEPKTEAITDAMTIIAQRNAFDPVRDWLDALPEWDQKPRLNTWLAKNFEAQGHEEYLAQVFRKWMIAMVLRVYQPGAKFDWMPIFEGTQGVGKSSFGRVLVGDEYFLDWLPNLNDKDSALGLQGMWGVEMGELSQFRRNELESIKAFVTRTVDKMRPPYGRRLIESARRCVFFGTTNRGKYLTDDTGNRRFKPVVVGALNFKALRKDREQLFAEAKWNYLNNLGEENNLELSGDAKIYEAEIHDEKMVEDESTVMTEAMQDFTKLVQNGEANFEFKKFRILDLFLGGGPLQKWKPDNRNCQFAAKMLKKLGATRVKINGLYHWKFSEGAGFLSTPDPLDFY